MKLPNKVYDILKWVAIIVLPALATFYTVLGGVWNLPFVEEIPITITAIATLLGTVLGISSINYEIDQKNNSDKEIG